MPSLEDLVGPLAWVCPPRSCICHLIICLLAAFPAVREVLEVCLLVCGVPQVDLAVGECLHRHTG